MMTKINEENLEMINGGVNFDGIRGTLNEALLISFISERLDSGISKEQIRKEVYDKYGREPWVTEILERTLAGNGSKIRICEWVSKDHKKTTTHR